MYFLSLEEMIWLKNQETSLRTHQWNDTLFGNLLWPKRLKQQSQSLTVVAAKANPIIQELYYLKKKSDKLLVRWTIISHDVIRKKKLINTIISNVL